MARWADPDFLRAEFGDVPMRVLGNTARAREFSYFREGDEGLNAVNDQCWAGSFSYWAEHKLMVYRYGLVLAGGQVASADQIDTMISAAVVASERYYPAFQLIAWAGKPPREALQIAIAEAYGRA